MLRPSIEKVNGQPCGVTGRSAVGICQLAKIAISLIDETYQPPILQ